MEAMTSLVSPNTMPEPASTAPPVVASALAVANALDGGRGQRKKVVVPGLFKPEKELTPKETEAELRKRASRRDNVKRKLVVATAAQEKANALAYAAQVHAHGNANAKAAQVALMINGWALASIIVMISHSSANNPPRWLGHTTTPS
jgi:hypothetical protein